MRRQSFAALLAVATFPLAALQPPRAAFGDDLSADAIFARAKAAWRARDEPPFVHFNLRERYTWRDRIHDNWWQAYYRQRDDSLALRRTIVAAQEEARMRGTPIALDVHFHNGLARADSLETNADADAFPILDPQIAPNASFGLSPLGPRAPQPALGGAVTPSPAPLQTPSPVPSAVPLPQTTVLREVGRVEAVSRDYRIALAGIEQVGTARAYHLTLTPLRDPRVYRLRDVWVDTATFATLQLALDGLFEGEPYASARWIVTYVPIGGSRFIQQIRADGQLRFGMDRYVSGLEFDFVQYDFPADVPDVTFERYL
jgi:hypothetical protein